MQKQTTNVFTYGTLMYRNTFNYLASQKYYQSFPAVLKGYSRRAVKDAFYPGIKIEPQSQVNGVLYLNITEKDLKSLDHYEGDIYEKIVVEVTTKDGTKYPTLAYLFKDVKLLEPHDWNQKQHEKDSSVNIDF